MARKDDLDELETFIRKASSALPKHYEVSQALQALERIARNAYPADESTQSSEPPAR